MASLMIMNRMPNKLNRSWWATALAGIAVLGVLTACSGSNDNTAPQSAG
jgi:hypothetical protein